MLTYSQMYNRCELISHNIHYDIMLQGHELLSRCVDVFVGDEKTEKYFIDFEARNRSGKYYRIYGNYTIDELKKMKVIL